MKRSWAAWFFVTAIVLLMCMPLIAILAQSIDSSEQQYLQHYLDTQVMFQLKNTALIVLATGLGSLLLGGGAALLIARQQFWGRDFFAVAFMLPCAIPSHLLCVIYRDLFTSSGPLHAGCAWLLGHGISWPTLFDGWDALLCGMILHYYPVVYLLVWVALVSIPHDFFDLSGVLGLSPARSWRKVLLPLLQPVVILAVSAMVLLTMGDYGAPSIFGIRSVSVAIYSLWHAIDKPSTAAQLIVALVFFVAALMMMVFYLLSRRVFFDPLSPQRANVTKTLPKLTRGFLSLCAGAIVFIGGVIPLGALFYWSALSLGHANLSMLYVDLFNTLRIVLPVTVISMVLGMLLAICIRYRTGALLGIIVSGVVALWFCVPAIAIAVGVLVMISGEASDIFSFMLSQSVTALIYAMVIRYLFFGFATAYLGLLKLPPHVDELGSCLLKTRWQRIKIVYWPHLRRWVAIGGMLVFAFSMGELTLPLSLAPYNFGTLATRIHFKLEYGTIYDAALWSLVFVICASYPFMKIAAMMKENTLK